MSYLKAVTATLRFAETLYYPSLLRFTVTTDPKLKSERQKEQERDMKSTRGWLCNPLSSLCNGARHLGSPVCFCPTQKVSSVHRGREKEVRKASKGAKRSTEKRTKMRAGVRLKKINPTF